MKDVTKHVTKTIVEGVIRSLNDSPEKWKVKKEISYCFPTGHIRRISMTHKLKPITVGYTFNSFLGISVWCDKQYMKKIPLSLRIKLKRVAKRVYRDYRAERRLFKLSKVMKSLK